MSLVQRRLLGVLGLFLISGLGGWLVWWQQQKSVADAEKKATDEKVFALKEIKDVKTLRLSNDTGTYVIDHLPDAAEELNWQMTEPLATLAEATTVEGMIEHFIELKQTKAIEDQALDLKLFGLEPARAKVEIVRSDGSSETVLIGKRNSFDGSVYVKKESDTRVVLVPGGIDYQVNKDLLALREKRLVIFATEDVQQASVSGQATKTDYKLAQHKGEEGWWIETQHPTRADDAQVNGVLSALNGLRAKTFVSEHNDIASLKKYGLDKPKLVSHVVLSDNRVVEIKLANQGDVPYATLGTDSPIIELASDWALKRLPVDFDTLRDKHVLLFDRDAVGLVVIKSDKEELKLQDITPKVKGLLYRLWNLKAERIETDAAKASDIAERHLEAPELTIALSKTPTDAPFAELLISKSHDAQRFVMLRGSSRIDMVDAAPLNDISLKADDYKEEATAARVGDQ